jgi:serine/threonine-protein kinase
VAVLRQTLPAQHWRVALTESALGDCLAALGRFEEAEPLLVRSPPRIEAVLGQSDRRTHAALRRIINLYEAWDRPEKAAEYRALLPIDKDSPQENEVP